jgi:hypothetical protein
MRTTITLDDRLARRVQDEMRARGTTFRQTLESLLEAGLEKKPGARKPRPFAVEARPMGLRPGIDPTQLQDIDTELEVERFLKVSVANRATKG